MMQTDPANFDDSKKPDADEQFDGVTDRQNSAQSAPHPLVHGPVAGQSHGLESLQGMRSQYWMPTGNLAEDVRFFEILGFRISKRTVDMALVTDGHFAVRLIATLQQPELVFFANDFEAARHTVQAQGLGTQTASIDVPDAAENMTTKGTLVLGQFSGLRLRLAPLEQSLDARCVNALGPFTEISLLCNTPETDAKEWSRVGFTADPKANPAHGYLRVSNDTLNVSLYEPRVIKHAFEGPVLTYFDQQMSHRIAYLTGRGLAMHEAATAQGKEVRDAIYRAPGGQMVFMFSFS